MHCILLCVEFSGAEIIVGLSLPFFAQNTKDYSRTEMKIPLEFIS